MLITLELAGDFYSIMEYYGAQTGNYTPEITHASWIIRNFPRK